MLSIAQPADCHCPNDVIPKRKKKFVYVSYFERVIVIFGRYNRKSMARWMAYNDVFVFHLYLVRFDSSFSFSFAFFSTLSRLVVLAIVLNIKPVMNRVVREFLVTFNKMLLCCAVLSVHQRNRLCLNRPTNQISINMNYWMMENINNAWIE